MRQVFVVIAIFALLNASMAVNQQVSTPLPSSYKNIGNRRSATTRHFLDRRDLQIIILLGVPEGK